MSARDEHDIAPGHRRSQNFAPERPNMPSPSESGTRLLVRRFITDYGMVFVLLLLMAGFSLLTIQPQRPTGAEDAHRGATFAVEQREISTCIGMKNIIWRKPALMARAMIRAITPVATPRIDKTVTTEITA